MPKPELYVASLYVAFSAEDQDAANDEAERLARNVGGVVVSVIPEPDPPSTVLTTPLPPDEDGYCAECGEPITGEEYEDRHSGPEGTSVEYHAECCPHCNPDPGDES